MQLSKQDWVTVVTRIFFLALPFLYFPMLTEPVMLPRQVLLNVFCFFLVLLLLFSGEKLMTDRRFFTTRLFLSCAGWILANILSGIFCINSAEWMAGLSKYILYVLFFMMLSVYLVAGKTDTRELTRSIILFAFLTTAIAGFEIIGMIIRSPGLSWLNLDTISSSIADKNLLASSLFLTFPFLLSAGSLGTSWKKFSTGIFTVQLIVLVIIQIKAVLLAGIIFFVVLFFYRKDFFRDEKKRKKRKTGNTPLYLLILILAASGLFAFNFFDNTFVQKVFAYTYKFHAVGTRLELWENSMGMIGHHFFTGVGTNHWQVWFPKEGLSKFSESVVHGISSYQEPHNDFLRVFSESGVMGFLFYAAIFFAGIHYGIRLTRNTTDKVMKRQTILFTATLIGYAVISLVDFPLAGIEHNVLFFTILSILTAGNLQRFNFPVKMWQVKKKLLVALSIILVLCFTVSCFRVNGEYHSEKLNRALKSGDWNQVLSEKENASAIFYNMDHFSTPLAWYSGVARLNKGEVKKAATELESAYKIHPYHLRTLIDLAGCYEKMNLHKKAIDYYEKAMEISPDFRESRLELSRAYFNAGDFQMAFVSISNCKPDTMDYAYMKILNSILEKKNMSMEEFMAEYKKSADKE
ncbi:MAG: O-antigen ligase family protein [Bacteroidetes bacterium]|nr:O-antigen ligase family protein [Bacteroidota bacterium]